MPSRVLDLEGLGIRDLCPWQDQLLILAGPTMTLDGPIKVFALPLADLSAEQPFLRPSMVMELPLTQNGDRAEGLTLIPNDQNPEILIVYDAPLPNRLQGNQAILADRFPLPGI